MERLDDVYDTLASALGSPRILQSKRRASVAIVLRDPAKADDSKLPQMLFIQRAPNPNDPWSAHIAFPGGRQDGSDDGSDLRTAVREAREELGLNLDDGSRYKLLGRLDDRPIFNNDFILSAFVFRQLRDDIPIEPADLQIQEVSSTFWISLRHLHHKSSKRTTHNSTIRLRSPRQRQCHLMAWHVMKKSFIRLIGLYHLRMAAVDVLSVATDRVYAKTTLDGPPVPHVMLWGLTLSCVGDIASSLQLRRADWPLYLPQGRLLGGLFWGAAEVWYFWRESIRHVVQILRR